MNIPLQRIADKYIGYFLIGLLIIPTRLLGLFLKRDHTQNKAPDEIMVIKLLGLGSLVQALDSIRQLKFHFPYSRIILVTESTTAAGIRPFQVFDEIRELRTSGIMVMMKDAARILFGALRVRHLWVVDLEVYSKLTTVFALLTCAINRFGFILSPVIFRKYLNTHNVVFGREKFIGENYHEIAGAVTTKNLEAETGRRIGVNRTGKYIVVNNTCSQLASVRKMSDKTFTGIIQWILQNTTYDVALAGAPEDYSSLDQMLNSHFETRKQGVKILAGEMLFDEYYTFLRSQCVCMVSIDSAPLHIAKYFGIPTVSVWGPTHPVHHFHIAEEESAYHELSYHAVSCSPCIHYTEKLPCGGDNFCMKEITSDEIIIRLKIVLKRIEAEQTVSRA